MTTSIMWQRKPITPRRTTAQHQQMPRDHQTFMLPTMYQNHRGVCVDGMGSVQKEHQICGECTSSSCPLREEWLPSTQQCDHHDRKPESGDPCEEAGGSQALNVVPYCKQPCGRNNIHIHSRSYTHQSKHIPLPTKNQPALKPTDACSFRALSNHGTTAQVNNYSTHLEGTCTQCSRVLSWN